MGQQYEISLALFIGVTDWRIGPPPEVGWWETTFADAGEPPPHVKPGTISRRWWDGERWSWPVGPGFHSAEDAEALKEKKSRLKPSALKYRGLLADCREPVLAFAAGVQRPLAGPISST